MRACWLKWVGRDWSISADYIWLNYSGANTAELQVRGDHRRLPLVGVGEDLEEGPRAVPRRAAGHDVGPFEVVNQ